MDRMVLIGSEDVARAGHQIASAADRMQSAAGSVGYELESFKRFMDDWLQRFEAALEKAKT